MTRKEPTLLIGEVAECAGVNPKTIRYYESIELLPKPRRSTGNYRLYSDEDVERLRFITSARALGFALDEIAEILAFKERGEAPCGFVLERLTIKSAEVERHLERLLVLRSEIKHLMARSKRLRGKGRYCGVIEHRTPRSADGSH
jgi:DNA-binding transcriptional MerR regulator